MDTCMKSTEYEDYNSCKWEIDLLPVTIHLIYPNGSEKIGNYIKQEFNHNYNEEEYEAGVVYEVFGDDGSYHLIIAMAGEPGDIDWESILVHESSHIASTIVNTIDLNKEEMLAILTEQVFDRFNRISQEIKEE